MKRIKAIIAACLVYVLFLTVFGWINKNEVTEKSRFEIQTNGFIDPGPPPPPSNAS